MGEGKKAAKLTLKGRKIKVFTQVEGRKDSTREKVMNNERYVSLAGG